MAPVWSLTSSLILKYIIAVWLLRQRPNFLNYFIHLTLRLIRVTRNLMLLLGSYSFRKNLIILSDIIFILLHLSILLRRRVRVLCICKINTSPLWWGLCQCFGNGSSPYEYWNKVALMRVICTLHWARCCSVEKSKWDNTDFSLPLLGLSNMSGQVRSCYSDKCITQL